jgi:flagellar biogenesis protein FliO
MTRFFSFLLLVALTSAGAVWAQDGGASTPVTGVQKSAAEPSATDRAALDKPSVDLLGAPLAPGQPPELGEQDLNLGWVLVRTLVVLGLVVASAYLILNIGLRRLLGVKAIGGPVVIDVLERVPLDTKRSLFVVKAAGEYLLIGGADASLNLIAKLDTAEVEKLRSQAKAASLTLSPLLEKLLSKKAIKVPPKET